MDATMSALEKDQKFVFHRTKTVLRSWAASFYHLKLGAVVTLGHDDIRLGLAVAQFLGCLRFGRTVAGERGLKAWKLEHHDAVARAALHHVASTAADQIACAELAEWRLIGDQVWLIGIGVGHVDLDDPVAFFARGRRR